MEKFNKAQAKNLAAAQKLVDAYASSSEDEGELDEKHILGTFSLCIIALNDVSSDLGPSLTHSRSAIQALSEHRLWLSL